MLSAFARALPALLIVPIVGFIDGARMPGGALGLLCLAVANQGAALIGGGWGVGMALRFKTMRAGPLMFLPVFVTVFLSPAQVPLQYLTGWLKPVAKVNPVTQILDLARAGFYKEFLWGNVWPGLVVLAVFIPLFGWFALRGLRRLD
jgi:ABC-type multidrug transport system permease subunit